MKYFAYGSNMNPARMQARGVRFSSRIKACLFGYGLKFNKTSARLAGEGYANIVKEDNGKVEGMLYEVSKECIENLDMYEQYPDHYNRKMFKLKIKNGTECMAYAYIAEPHKTSDNLKPSRQYLSHLLCANDLLTSEYISKLCAQKTID
jgi:gamma-glutamylcyclotransferase